MNLEAIALMRAQEQMRRPSSILVEDPKPRPRVHSLTRRRLVCYCGICHTCKNREAMRKRRGSGKTTARVRPMCTVEGCLKRVVALGLCQRHYRQQERWGVVVPCRLRVASPRTVEAARARLAAKGITLEVA